MSLSEPLMDEDEANVARLIALSITAATLLAGAAAKAVPERGRGGIVAIDFVLALLPGRSGVVHSGSMTDGC